MTDKPYTHADVELVARAIYLDDWPEKTADDWANVGPSEDEYRQNARAVLDALATAGRLAPAASTEPEQPALGSPADRAQEQPEREEVRWAYRWIGPDGQVYDEMDASNNAIEIAEQRAHRIAGLLPNGAVRGEVLRYRVLTMPAEVVATYPAEREG